MPQVTRRIPVTYICLMYFLCACTPFDNVPLPTKAETETRQVAPIEAPDLTPRPSSVIVQSSTKESMKNDTHADLESTATIRPTTESSVTPSAAANTKSLVGPLVAFFMDDDDFYLSILDVQSGEFREIRNEPFEYAFEPQWVGNGCQMFIRGNAIDLKGNTLWHAPAEIAKLAGSFSGTRLSPNNTWLAYPIFSGAQTYEATEFIDVAIVRFAPPFDSTILSRNGGSYPGAFAWSFDEDWLVFSDYDANGILQIYKANANGKDMQQLTSHTEPIGRIEYIALSPDNQQVAYAVTNLLHTSLPYQYDQKDEGWVGLVSISGMIERRITSEKLGSIRDKGIWWSSDSTQIVFIADSLPLPTFVKQIHWAEVESGVIVDSIYESDVSFGNFGFAVSVRDADTILLDTEEGLILLENRGEEYRYVGAFQSQGIIRDISVAPFNFPGEDECTYDF